MPNLNLKAMIGAIGASALGFSASLGITMLFVKFAMSDCLTYHGITGRCDPNGFATSIIYLLGAVLGLVFGAIAAIFTYRYLNHNSETK